MKTKNIFLAAVLTLGLWAWTLELGILSAQTPGEWTWMAGDNTPNQSGVYGIQGVAAPTNKPEARYEGGGEWVDLQGNFWHFGGRLNPFSRNDLWKFDPVTNQWTWIKGSILTNQPGVYGTLGVPNVANTPGARGLASATCVDLQGQFWLFGGAGYVASGGFGMLNDLWKYDPLSNRWTWMGGTPLLDQPGTYGTRGLPSATNKPGARGETDAMWADTQGNIWMFGGKGFGSVGGVGRLNDLWKFDPVTSQWTWMSGSNIIDQPGVYGIQGIAAPANVPGARYIYASWKDLAGDFWIFGGVRFSAPTALYDDLWKYAPNTNMWTWIKGTNGAGNINGTYGIKCVDAPNNNPPARVESRARWEDDCGNFWLWGGYRMGGYLNDLWRYSHATGNWTWVSGSNLPNQVGVYGIKGVSASANMPGARWGSLTFRRSPNTNELWFFGGESAFGEFNDMWRYIPDKPTASFTFNPNNACAPATVSFTNTSTPGCNEIKSLAWNFGDPSSGVNNTSPLVSPSHVFNAPGTYTVQLVVINCTASKDTATQIVTVINCGNLSVSATSTNVLCNGQCTGSSAAAATGGSPPYTYLWNTSQTTQIATGLCAGTAYTVTVTDAANSTTTATVTITQPSAITLTTGSTPAPDGTATVNHSGGTPSYTYLWNTIPAQTTQTATGLSAAIYCCTIIDANDCKDSSCVMVTAADTLHCATAGELYIPNAFSPNNDGENDVIKIYYGNYACITTFKLVIYDRWGEKVFETENPIAEWKGSYKGKKEKSAVFAYYMEVTLISGEEIIRKGNVSLIK